MASTVEISARVVANTRQFMTGTDQVKKRLRELGQVAGSKSALGQTMAVLRGGGVLSAFGMAGEQTKQFTGRLLEMSNAMKSGQLYGSELNHKLLSAIPIFGRFYEAGTDINEMLTRQRYELGRTVNEYNNLEKLTDLSTKINIQHAEAMGDTVRANQLKNKAVRAYTQDEINEIIAERFELAGIPVQRGPSVDGKKGKVITRGWGERSPSDSASLGTILSYNQKYTYKDYDREQREKELRIETGVIQELKQKANEIEKYNNMAMYAPGSAIQQSPSRQLGSDQEILQVLKQIRDNTASPPRMGN